jgi:hypothetical protein
MPPQNLSASRCDNEYAEDDPGFHYYPNNGKKISILRFWRTWNRIVVVRPSGEEVEVFHFVRELEPTIIKPAQSKTWDVELSGIFDTMKFEEAGTYRFSFKTRCNVLDDNVLVQIKRRLHLKEREVACR